NVITGSNTFVFAVHDGQWRGFVPLEPGINNLTIASPGSSSTNLTLNYVPLHNSKKIRLVYVLGSDSNGEFDAPNGVPHGIDQATARLILAGRLMQSMTAELFYEKGFTRQTFSLVSDSNNAPVVDVVRSPMSVSEIRTTSGGDLWSHFNDLLGDYANRDQVIDVVVMADTHYDSETGEVQGHTALGGGRLALFGSATLHTFPENVQEVEQHFVDSAQIESYLFPEYGRSDQYWAIFSTSIGAMLHEAGHCLGLPHPDPPVENAIMWRGFDYLNRLATTYEPGFGAIDPDLAMMPMWTDENATALLSNPWLYSNHSNINHNYIPIVLKPSVAPLPTGQATINDAFSDYDRSGFQFSSNSVVAWNSNAADLLAAKAQSSSLVSFFLQYDAPPYNDPEIDKDARSGIIEMPLTELEQVSECPETGYEHHWVEASADGVYCVRTRDGEHYAAIKLTLLDESSLSFTWLYQPDGSRKFH
ncbi:MAG: hypothetical protein ACK2TV_03195, partial [Anaerolineales bacterium]